MGGSKADPWIFNYRSYLPDDSDSDSADNEPKASDESRLWSELDISSRADTAVFKPNPFSIAKINASTRSARATVAKTNTIRPNPPPPPKKIGTIDAFFGKMDQNTVEESGTMCITHKSPNSTAILDQNAPTRVGEVLRPGNFHEDNIHALSSASKVVDRRWKLQKQVAIVEDGPEHTAPRTDFSGVRTRPHPRPVQARVKRESSTSALSPLAPVELDRKASNIIPPQLSSSDFASPRFVLSTSTDIRGNMPPARVAELKPIPTLSSAIHPGVATPSQESPAEQMIAKRPRLGSTAHTSMSTAKPPKCYDPRSDEDELWSTLPPRNKKFKPSIQPVPKYKNSGRFRIPGLCDNPDVLKTGMSATSSTRVITFLPTPLFSDPKSEVEVKTIRQYPSPQSSPFSQKYLGFDEDIDTGHDGYSSPPTSEPIQPDCDVDFHWDTHDTRERYRKVPEMIEEV